MQHLPPTSTQLSSPSDGFASTSADIEADGISPVCSANLTKQQYEDMMYDLRDKQLGNPDGSDLHDKVM
jgi:hypothetical protein